ncbi:MULTISPECIES: hypothetical protein [Streptomyces]|nr:hypothetical protein [Streptomyces durhamensis]
MPHRQDTNDTVAAGGLPQPLVLDLQDAHDPHQLPEGSTQPVALDP